MPIVSTISISASSKPRSLEYQRLTKTDDLMLNQYQLLVKKSEKELIQRLQDLSEKFESWRVRSIELSRNSRYFGADHHLYQPLIHLSHGDGKESLVKIIPTHLNDGEKQFVNDLEVLLQSRSHGDVRPRPNFTSFAITARTRRSASSPRPASDPTSSSGC